MAIRTESITSESDLYEVWKDPLCPNLDFGFIEQSFEDCYQKDDTYQATYETLDVAEGESFSMTYLCAETNATKTYTLTAGEYGIKP
jgi:hypothetical protein